MLVPLNGGVLSKSSSHLFSQSSIAFCQPSEPLLPKRPRVWNWVKINVSGSAKRQKSRAFATGAITRISQISDGGGSRRLRNLPPCLLPNTCSFKVQRTKAASTELRPTSVFTAEDALAKSSNAVSARYSRRPGFLRLRGTYLVSSPLASSASTLSVIDI